MSTAKHNSFRKVLTRENSVTTWAGQDVSVVTVIWCAIESLTSRTVKTKHIGITTYVGGRKFTGIAGIFPHKPVSISLKNPMSAKIFAEVNLKRRFQESASMALRRYIMGAPERCKGLTGTVAWYTADRGVGYITGHTSGEEFVVHGCNIKGAKTGYPETACTYLVKGETVTFDLFDFGDHLSAVDVSGSVHFDQAKWMSLDHSKLAFKKNDDGSFANGLFE